jgi:hypothetical protein
MDPLAIAAIVGLVFAGKKLSENNDSIVTYTQSTSAPTTTRSVTRRDLDLMSNARDHEKDAFDLRPTNPDLGRRVGDWRLTPKDAVPSLQDTKMDTRTFPHGQPVYNLYEREYITNKLNNLQPIERMNVGPGLGYGSNVAAAGGFHQFFRALPTNINEEKLTTIEGRDGPPAFFVPNGGPVPLGLVSHEAKDTKTAYQPPVQSRAEGQGGAITKPEKRPEFSKTARTTIRQQTGQRKDTLSDGPGQYNVYQPYAEGGEDAYTNKALTRSSDDRCKPDRAGNGGRMNVRNDPLNVIGLMTELRPETTPFPVGPVNATTGGRVQQYVDSRFYKFNERKSHANPYASPHSLDVAIQALHGNPVAVTPLATV